MSNSIKLVASDRIIYAVPKRVTPPDHIPILVNEKARVKFYSDNVIGNKRADKEALTPAFGISAFSPETKSKKKQEILHKGSSHFGLSFQPGSPGSKRSSNVISLQETNDTEFRLFLKAELESSLIAKTASHPCDKSTMSKDFSNEETCSNASIRRNVQRCPGPFPKFLASIRVKLDPNDPTGPDQCDLEDLIDEEQSDLL
jgi:hypothetical protein